MEGPAEWRIMKELKNKSGNVLYEIARTWYLWHMPGVDRNIRMLCGADCEP